MEGYQPVPVEEARAIAEKYAKSIVIIFAHDPVHGLMHTTTYGTDPQNKLWAAQGGELATRALGGVVELAVGFEDYRIAQAHNLLVALKSAVRIIESLTVWAKARHRAEIDAIHAAVKQAEEFIP